MKIVADENIPYVKEAFATLGDVTLRPGREIAPEDVRDAELLLVRSVTPVDRKLLTGSAIRFVGTATIGEDHIDRAWLSEQQIAFASAPGCNANSVGDYMVAALLHLADKYRFPLSKSSLGIIGVGNVGSKVAQRAEALGMRVVLNDPPLADATGDPKYRPLEDILACDIVTTHVPLSDGGHYPTRYLIDEEFLAEMKTGSFYINTSRGAVADNGALLQSLNNGPLRGVVLDVWENEPKVRLDLLEMADIATPHIAGYSFDGKVDGTRQIYVAACRHLGTAPVWTPDGAMPPPEYQELQLYGGAGDLKRAAHTVYPILDDDERMRRMLDEPADRRAAYFDHLRKSYPRRREFHNTHVRLKKANPVLVERLRGIGFRVQ